MEYKMDLEAFVCEDGGQGEYVNGVLHFFITGGAWPTLRFSLPNMQKYNSVSFSVKMTNVPSVSTVIHSKGRRAICGLREIIKKREFCQGEWKQITWHYRKRPGWVTPSLEPFDFDGADAFDFTLDGRYSAGECWIKDVVFSEEDVLEQQDAEFEIFLKDHQQKDTLKGKKALIWANSTANDGCSVQSTIDKFEYYKDLTGFDGLIMEITGEPKSDPFRDTIFTGEDLNEEIFQKAIDAYKAHDWQHFKDNFIRMDIVGIARFKNEDGSKRVLDWFDDDLFYGKIYPKLARFIRALKEIGVSLAFDNEAYNDNPYDYYYKYKPSGKTFKEYEKQVRLRGKEIAETISREYPNATVLLLFGNWVVNLPKDEDRYGLLPALLDGMCEANTSLKLIDGYEKGYDFTDYESVVKGVFECEKLTVKQSDIPELYSKTMHYGFGYWVRTSQEFRKASLYPLFGTQEYVWYYTEVTPVDREDVHEYFLEISKEIERLKGV